MEVKTGLLAGAVVVSVAAAVCSPMSYCRDGKLCRIEVGELPHTHDRAPAPVRTIGFTSVAASTTAGVSGSIGVAK